MINVYLKKFGIEKTLLMRSVGYKETKQYMLTKRFIDNSERVLKDLGVK